MRYNIVSEFFPIHLFTPERRTLNTKGSSSYQNVAVFVLSNARLRFPRISKHRNNSRHFTILLQKPQNVREDSMQFDNIP